MFVYALKLSQWLSWHHAYTLHWIALLNWISETYQMMNSYCIPVQVHSVV